MSNKKTDKTNLPSHRIYGVSKIDGKTRWAEIGAVFPHRKDMKGYSLLFKARPLEGAAIVLRVIEPKKAA